MKKNVTIRSYYRDISDYHTKFVQFFTQKGFGVKLLSHEKTNVCAKTGNQSKSVLEMIFEITHENWDDSRFEFYYDMFRRQVLVLNSSFDYVVKIE